MWTPTREAGLQRLHAFLPRAARAYRETRNHDFGRDKRTNVSGLSPYIRHRLILEEEVLRAVLGEHRFSAAEKFVQEVFWRVYWKGWLEHRPDVWRDYRADLDRATRDLADAPQRAAAYREAMQGGTGIEPFDLWARELVETGYLHNHARMWFASIWIFTLELPWQMGADFFLRHLLDGDAASNTLSWRWVAGLHTRGKTYLARADNIARYTAREAPGARPWRGLEGLAVRAPALEEAELAPPREIRWPPPFNPAGRQGLLLTEEDLSLDVPLEPDAVACLRPPADPQISPAPGVLDFRRAAIEDAARRSAAEWPAAPVVALASAAEVAAWAQRLGLDSVVVAYQPVGFVRDEVGAAERLLADAGIRLQRFVRELDRLAWPHATRGFGQLARRIKDVLSALGIGAG